MHIAFRTFQLASISYWSSVFSSVVYTIHFGFCELRMSLSPNKALSLIMAGRGGREVATCEAGYSSHICNVAA